MLRHKVGIGVLAVGWLASWFGAVLPVFAAAPTVDPPDALEVHALLADGEATAILRLTAPARPTDVTLTADGLEWETTPLPARGSPSASGSPSGTPSHPPLDRSAVSFDPSMLTLVPGRPADVLVTVKGFPRPGTYSGLITITYGFPAPATGAPASGLPSTAATRTPPPTPVVLPAVAVRLVVHVTEAAAIEPLAETPIEIAKTQCGYWFDVGLLTDLECRLAAALVGPNEARSEFSVQVHNKGIDPVFITDPRWSFVGSGAGATIAPEALSVTPPAAAIPGGGLSQIDFEVVADSIRPDSYEGAVTLEVTGSGTPTVLKSQILVRAGPLSSLLWILAGVAAVFLVAWLARRQQAAADASSGMSLVEAAWLRLDERDRDLLAELRTGLSAARIKGNWGDAESRGTQTLVSLIDTLGIVREFENRIPGAVAARFPRTFAAIQSAREFARQKDEASAGSQADVATIAWAEEARALADAEAAVGERAFADDLMRQNVIAGRRPIIGPDRRASGVLRTRPQLFQVSSATRDRAFKIGWGLVRFGSLVIFVILGLRIAYVEQVATFTGSALSEALPLIAWGVGADSVARFLGGLTKPKAA